jgi:hypothetical protein
VNFSSCSPTDVFVWFRLSLVRYNITGIAAFAAEMEEKGLGKPKVSLQFELSNSGITQLVKAEAAVEETYMGEEVIEVDDDSEEDVLEVVEEVATLNETEEKKDDTVEESKDEKAEENKDDKKDEKKKDDKTKGEKKTKDKKEKPKKKKKKVTVEKVSTISVLSTVMLAPCPI